MVQSISKKTKHICPPYLVGGIRPIDGHKEVMAGPLLEHRHRPRRPLHHLVHLRRRHGSRHGSARCIEGKIDVRYREI